MGPLGPTPSEGRMLRIALYSLDQVVVARYPRTRQVGDNEYQNQQSDRFWAELLVALVADRWYRVLPRPASWPPMVAKPPTRLIRPFNVQVGRSKNLCSTILYFYLSRLRKVEMKDERCEPAKRARWRNTFRRIWENSVGPVGTAVS